MFILTEHTDTIGTITLNQPAKRNALSEVLVEELIKALADFQQAGMRAVVLRAARDAHVWSSGHDISELPQGQDPDDLLRAAGRDAVHEVIGGARPLAHMLWMREAEAGSLDTPERRAHYGVTTYPVTILIAPDGTVENGWMGPLPPAALS